jgi:cytochrome b pre-mRNA-processing protein 6
VNDPSESAKSPKSTSPVPSKADVPATGASTHAQPANPQLETAQITALYSLLEDRYAKKYPLGDAVFKPASAPDHYSKLMDEIERAPQKTWWQAKVDEWKMKIRWQ